MPIDLDKFAGTRPPFLLSEKTARYIHAALPLWNSGVGLDFNDGCVRRYIDGLVYEALENALDFFGAIRRDGLQKNMPLDAAAQMHFTFSRSILSQLPVHAEDYDALTQSLEKDLLTALRLNRQVLSGKWGALYCDRGAVTWAPTPPEAHPMGASPFQAAVPA